MEYRDYFPDYINQIYKQDDGSSRDQKTTKTLNDVVWLIEEVWCISNAEYQQKIWVNHENPKIWDSYDDSTMYFIEDAYGMIKEYNNNNLSMTDEQYKKLSKLHDMVEAYDLSTERPDDDASIFNDPKWNTIRQYAKLVCKEITGQEA